jgi:hypothetical protein
MKKTLLEKEWVVSSFSKLQTCIQINQNTKVKNNKKKIIIQNNNNNRKHIKIKKWKRWKFKKKLKHEPNIVKITHLCITHNVQLLFLFIYIPTKMVTTLKLHISKDVVDEMKLSIHPWMASLQPMWLRFCYMRRNSCHHKIERV